jgi:hypothetical protein
MDHDTAFREGWEAYHAVKNLSEGEIIAIFVAAEDCGQSYYAEWKRGWLAAFDAE